VLEILGQIDYRHPSATDLLLDPVPVRHGGAQSVSNGSHGIPLPWLQVEGNLPRRD
jgi:hypothetical protein